MTRADSPPSPLRSPPRSSESSRSSRGKRSSKDHEKSLLGSASRELVKLLVHEEHEAKQLRSMLQILSERLNNETSRADAAEARAEDAVLRFKQVNEARLAAVQNASRLHEELELYKLQLENAQREIRRAQELLDALELQRFDAEEAAARARSTARKLKEEKIVQLARDEGRLEGVREGITRGRIIGYEEGRCEACARGHPPPPAREFKRGTATPPDNPPFDDFRTQTFAPSESDSTVQEQSRQELRQEQSQQDQPRSDRSPSPQEKIVVHSPRTPALRQSPPQSPQPAIHPIPIYNIPPSPKPSVADYPPEGWIPSVDPDQRIRLPPPHEMSPNPFTPAHTPPPTHILPPTTPEQPILMIPPPSQRATVETVRDSDSVSGAEAVRRPIRRRKSSDSQSTTFSQFDIVGPPNAPPVRANSTHRPNVLSAIVEERPSSAEASPYVRPASPRTPSPVTMPSPQAPIPIMPLSTQEDYYRRPGSSSSAGTSTRRAPSRSQSRGQLRPPPASPMGSIASNAGFNITVEPPSRPSSGRSGFMANEQGMLSASDAEHPSAPSSPAQPQPSQVPEAQSSPQPIPIPHGQLPPGFIPIGPPVPSPQITTQNVTRETPAVYGLYTPASGAGDTPPSTEPVVVPLSGPPRYSRSALQKDSSDESSSNSDPVSSSMSSSSMDSFTTPPQRRRPVPPPPYEVAETPPDITYPLPPSRTSSAARVPLPPSTVADSPQTTIAGARVPLPASTVGSPRSVYTRASRRGAATPSAVGQPSETPPIVVPSRSTGS
ncbi:uncharacterized protein PHACADRAFT_206157 [Phanerochaete carnosa HHB-10118-sp]|uniref:Uncharacterized protein n=1 Tax=Phanerochaete carnosa (strain HHB-10118-sp) TaxID=650164 RepID=K5W7L9_PHACS|nr:uncharacterized protein PHACADRAFT_206157 [Phanerochaete carnosa HHB-10118-sp]EKM59938.1 hypothetical protein PHACADRAFT_206157 [Phanerochaete carnosa HHB-10118-sp]